MNIKVQTREEVRPGLIIEYLQNNQPVLAWVMETQTARIRALNINQREVKLPLSRILPWPGPAYAQMLSREEILGILKEHNRKRLEEQEKIKILEVWEMAQGEINQARASWFAGMIWSDPGHDQVAALGRVMLQDRAHFKFNPPCFEVYPQDMVEQRLEQEKLTKERERLISIGRDFFKALWESGKKQTPVPDIEEKEIEDKLTSLLTTRIKHPDDSETQEIWSKITTGLPQDPNLAFILATNWGIYSPHHNFILDQADYCWDNSWAEGHQDEIRGIKEVFQNQFREPELTGFVSIDSQTTRDIDDAFMVEARGSGFTLTLALACPALGWQPGSGLDRAVAHRATSIYLPEGTSNMLPDVLAEDLFSLVEKQPRPALILKLEMDENAAVQNLEINRDWVRVDSNLTYDYVEQQLADSSSTSLETAWRLAELLQKKRLEQGAVIIRQSDPEIVLYKNQGRIKATIEDKPQCHRAQLIVAEFMILANSTVAQWARDAELPLLYRTQDIALPQDYSGVWSKPEDIYPVIRALGATLTETVPRQHRSIAVPCYAPVSSPLRRYTDLINEIQILGYLQENRPPLSRETMDAMLADLNARIAAVSQVQKFRPRYWKLVYFKQNCKTTTWQGIVVDSSGPFIVLNLPRELMMVRARRELFGGKAMLGQAFRLRLGRIDPLNNEINVLEAWEE
ncbi:MAG: ribonuclease catalytic domain-containing protein [Desulfonatronovibrio sp.]